MRSYAASCWLGLGVILLHNLEEALTAPQWLDAHAAELRVRFGLERIPAASAPAFLTSLTILTAVILVWIAFASRARPRSAGVYGCVFLFAVFFGNALVPHLAGAMLLGAYVPGVATAVLLVIPFTVLWSVKAFREGWVRGPAFFAAAAVGLLFYGLLGVPALLGVR